MKDYRAALVEMIGQETIDAVRALDAGRPPREVYLHFLEGRLSDSLARVMACARQNGEVTSADVAGVLGKGSASRNSNVLSDLRRAGLLVRVGESVIAGGGRSYVYKPWDS